MMPREEISRGVAGYKALQRVTVAIRSQVDLGRVLDTLVADTGRFLDLALCSIARWDETGRWLLFSSEYRRDPNRASSLSLQGRRFEPGAEPSASNLETLLFKDQMSLISTAALRPSSDAAFLACLIDSAYVVTPMVAGQRLAGLLVVARPRALPAWSDEEVEFLRAAADLAAVALQHATMRSQLRIILAAGAEFNSRLAPRDLLRRLTEAAMSVTHSMMGVAGLVEGDEMICRELCQCGSWSQVDVRFARGQGLPGWVWAYRAPCIANDAAGDPRATPEMVERFGVRSALTIPIINRDGEVLGFFGMHNKAAGAPYDGEDVSLATALANHAAMALDLTEG